MSEDRFTHRVVDAATAPRIATTGQSSPFTMARSPIEDKTKVIKPRGYARAKPTAESQPKQSSPRKTREGSLRQRFLQTLEACGSLNSQAIAEGMGITVKQASDLATQMVARGLVIRSGERGDRTYQVANRTGGFHKWLEKKAGLPAPAEKGRAARVVKPKTKLVPAQEKAAPDAAADVRCALFNTGALLIEANGSSLELNRQQANNLVSYLDMISGALSAANGARA